MPWSSLSVTQTPRSQREIKAIIGDGERRPHPFINYISFFDKIFYFPLVFYKKVRYNIY